MSDEFNKIRGPGGMTWEERRKHIQSLTPPENQPRELPVSGFTLDAFKRDLGNYREGIVNLALGFTQDLAEQARKAIELQKNYKEECDRADQLEDLYIAEAKENHKLRELVKAADEFIEYYMSSGLPYDKRTGMFKHYYSMYDRAKDQLSEKEGE